MFFKNIEVIPAPPQKKKKIKTPQPQNSKSNKNKMSSTVRSGCFWEVKTASFVTCLIDLFDSLYYVHIEHTKVMFKKYK